MQELTILLFVLGILLFLAEVFIIPGFGIAGISGLIAIISASILLAPSIKMAIFYILLSLILIAILILILLRFLPTKKLAGKIVLGTRQINDEGYSIAEKNLQALQGKIGMTLSMLRPAGIAVIEGKRYDVISEGNFIPANTEIRVIRVVGSKIIVEEQKNTRG